MANLTYFEVQCFLECPLSLLFLKFDPVAPPSPSPPHPHDATSHSCTVSQF